MPYTNVPLELTEKMDSCVTEVQTQGYSKEKAIAICYASVVEAETTPTQEQQRVTLNTPRWLASAQVAEGRAWEITIIGAETPDDVVLVNGTEYIRSKNGRLYATDGIRDSVPLWEGVKVYDNHLTDNEFSERAGMRSFLTEGVGVLTAPHWDAVNKCLRATLKIVDDEARHKLLNAYREGVIQHIGLSVDTLTQEGNAVMYEGQRYLTMTAFEHIFSLDIVSEPAAGGRFNRVIAAKQNSMEDRDMTLTEEQVRTIVAEALAARDTEQAELTAEDAAEIVADAVEGAVMDAPADADPAEVAMEMADAAVEAAEMVAEEQTAAEDEMTNTTERLHKLECKLLLTEKLEAAKLPTAQRRVVEAAFNGRIFTEAELMNVIKRAKEAQATGDNTGKVNAPAGRSVSLASTLSPADKAAIGFMELMGGRWGGLRNVESSEADYVNERLPQWFKSWQNAGRPRYTPRKLSNWLYDFVGDPHSMRATEANDVSSITKNAVNLFLAARYSVREEWWTPIVSELEVQTIDDATLVRTYGFEDLDIVAEGAAYTAIDLSDDEETASFVKRGNYVGVTLETMLKDKLGVLQDIPQRLSNSWYNTLSGYVARVFTENSNTGPVLTDTGALFNATATTTAGGHANLLTAALSFTAYTAAQTAMIKQTDKKLGAGTKLLIRPRYLLVPVDLETTAEQIRNSQYLPNSGNNDVNPHYQKFDIITVPDWTDANDWALVADPQVYPAIYMIYVAGHRVPQIVDAGDESTGAMFTNDTWRYKVRLMTFRYSSTYDCAPVADFRPLHKSNV